VRFREVIESASGQEFDNGISKIVSRPLIDELLRPEDMKVPLVFQWTRKRLVDDSMYIAHISGQQN